MCAREDDPSMHDPWVDAQEARITEGLMRSQAHPIVKRGPDRRRSQRRLDDMISASMSLTEFQEIEAEYRRRQQIRNAFYQKEQEEAARNAAIVTTIILGCAGLFIVGFAFAVAKFIGLL